MPLKWLELTGCNQCNVHIDAKQNVHCSIFVRFPKQRLKQWNMQAPIGIEVKSLVHY